MFFLLNHPISKVALVSLCSVRFVHEIVSLLCTWEALVDELEWVVVESFVLFEVVLLALEELVHFDEVGGILAISELEIKLVRIRN